MTWTFDVDGEIIVETDEEASALAKKRLGKDAFAATVQGVKVVGTRKKGKYLSFTSNYLQAGYGATWEAAFADHDRKFGGKKG